MRRRWAACATAGLLAVATLPAAARADDSSQAVQATVLGPTGGTSSATVAQLMPGCQGYTGGGYDPSTQFPPGRTWAVGTLLGCLQPAIELLPSTSVIIGSAQLSYADLSDPSDFAVPSQEPVIFSDGTNLHFERPARNPGDDNGADSEVVAPPQPLTLSVTNGPALTVTVTATPSTVAPGGTVSLTTTVTGGGATDYGWSFADGETTASGPDPTVTLPANVPPGGDRVTVTATDPATGAAGVASATITVTGTPSAAATTTTGTTTAPPASTTTASAPAGGHGGRTGARHGTGTGTAARTTTTTATATATTSSRTTTASATTTSSPTTPTTTASPAAPRTTPSPRQRRPARTPAPTPRPVARPHRASDHRTTPAGAPRPGTRVSGELIASLTPVALSRSPLARTSAAPAVGASASVVHVGRFTWPAALTATAIVLALLSLGAGRELRARRTR